jgi:hypothetical protein
MFPRSVFDSNFFSFSQKQIQALLQSGAFLFACGVLV